MASVEKETNFSSARERKSDFCWTGFSHSELNIFPHHVLSEHNIHNTSLADLQTGEAFPFKCTPHLPFLPPNSLDMSLCNADPAASLVHRKQEWSNRIDRIVKKYRMKYNQSFESIERPISDDCQSAVMPNHMAAFMELIETDPDTHFSGVTNWYYAGGRLSYVTVDGQMVLLTSGGGRNEKLFAIPLTEHVETGWQPALRASTKEQTTANEPILEIVGRSNDSSGLIGVRQRHLCSVYMLLPEGGSFQLRGTHRATSEQQPFTSMQFCPRDYGLYCTASVNRQLSLWDAQSCNCIASDVVEKPDCNLSNSWSGVQFRDSPCSLLMADAGSLSWLDARIGLSKPTARFCLKDESSLLSPCEDISLVVPSTALYIATTHHLLHYEPRTGHILQRWTHLLRSPPLYGQSVASAGRHMICLANQEPAEVALIDSVATSTLLPYGLPTLPETLHCCQMRGQLLDPRAQQRLKASVAGVLCLPRDDGDSYQVLTQTALGDVFSQHLGKSNPVAEQCSSYDDRINVWNDECLKTDCRKAAEITGEKSYKAVFDSLQNPDFKMRPYDRTFSLQESLRISKGQLFCYKDMLAPDLLAAWNVESIPEWGESEVPSDDARSSHLNLSSVSYGEDEQHCLDAPLPRVSKQAIETQLVAASGSLSRGMETQLIATSCSLSKGMETQVVATSGSISRGIETQLIATSGSLSRSMETQLVATSGSISRGMETQLVATSGSLSRAMEAQLVATSGSLSRAMEAQLVATSGSISRGIETQLVATSGSLSRTLETQLVATSGSISRAMETQLVATSGSISREMETQLVATSGSLSSPAELQSASQELSTSTRPTIRKLDLNKSNELAIKRRSNVSGF